MKRKQFIFRVGQGVLFTCAGACVLASCSSGDDGMENINNGGDNGGSNGGGNPGGDDTVSISLNDIPEIGDQKSQSGILFIRIGNGNDPSDFVATEAVCPHQGGQLVYVAGEGYIECQLHFARYENDGDTIRGPQGSSGNTRDLVIYDLDVDGTSLVATK